VGWSQGPRLDEDDCQANVPDRYDVVVEPISGVVDPRGWDRNQFNEFSRENRGLPLRRPNLSASQNGQHRLLDGTLAKQAHHRGNDVDVSAFWKIIDDARSNATSCTLL
jgi:hypothetical protein